MVIYTKEKLRAVFCSFIFLTKNNILQFQDIAIATA